MFFYSKLISHLFVSSIFKQFHPNLFFPKWHSILFRWSFVISASSFYSVPNSSIFSFNLFSNFTLQSKQDWQLYLNFTNWDVMKYSLFWEIFTMATKHLASNRIQNKVWTINKQFYENQIIKIFTIKWQSNTSQKTRSAGVNLGGWVHPVCTPP